MKTGIKRFYPALKQKHSTKALAPCGIFHHLFLFNPFCVLLSMMLETSKYNLGFPSNTRSITIIFTSKLTSRMTTTHSHSQMCHITSLPSCHCLSTTSISASTITYTTNIAASQLQLIPASFFCFCCHTGLLWKFFKFFPEAECHGGKTSYKCIL